MLCPSFFRPPAADATRNSRQRGWQILKSGANKRLAVECKSFFLAPVNDYGPEAQIDLALHSSN